MERKKYCLVGTGGRAGMYVTAIAKTYRDRAELVGLCDVNQARMDFYLKYYLPELCDYHQPVPTWKAHEFDRMIAEARPDAVIVTSVDRTHHRYICRALELGCEVITEKPMTIDAEKCQQILDTVKRTGGKLTVTFNYRYAPRNAKVREVLQSGLVGEITTVHFEWLLDTSHGADYFRRWHRNKANSGGLLVHKATHHFDLMNWWLDSSPELVYALGDLKFYGRANAERRGVTEFYDRARDNAVAARDPFALKITDRDVILKGLYYDAEHEDGYYRDRSVFADSIDIEDNMSVIVRYRNRAVMTYCLHAHAPWEGYRVAFNGTRGRLEFNVVEKSYVSGGAEDFNQPGMRELGKDRSQLVPELIFQPHWGTAREIPIVCDNLAGHGGGDERLLRHLFVGVDEDPLGQAAGYRDGANSILTGIAANQSMRTGLPVRVDSLVKEY